MKKMALFGLVLPFHLIGMDLGHSSRANDLEELMRKSICTFDEEAGRVKALREAEKKRLQELREAQITYKQEQDKIGMKRKEEQWIEFRRIVARQTGGTLDRVAIFALMPPMKEITRVRRGVYRKPDNQYWINLMKRHLANQYNQLYRLLSHEKSENAEQQCERDEALRGAHISLQSIADGLQASSHESLIEWGNAIKGEEH